MNKGTFLMVVLPILVLSLMSLVQYVRSSKMLAKRKQPTGTKMNIQTTTLVNIVAISNVVSVIITGLLILLIFISGIVNVPDNFPVLLLHYLVTILIYNTISDFMFRVVSYIYLYLSLKGKK